MGRFVLCAALLGCMVVTPWVAAEDKTAGQPASPATHPTGEATAGQAAAAAAVAPAPIPPPPPPAPKYKTKEEGVRAQLEETKWTITLSPMDEASKAKPKTDTLTFAKNEVTSDRLTKLGYSSSRYSLTINGNNIVWDTMHSHEKEGTILWHGELAGVAMRGMVSERSPNGKSADFNISGSEASGKTITVPSEKDLQPAASTGGQTAQAANGAEEKRGYLW